MKQKISESDNIIGDIHKVRKDLLDSHNGDLSSLFDELKRKQNEAGQRLVSHVNSSDTKIKQQSN